MVEPNASAATHRGELILISGRVQGVGFRPHVWRIADSLSLNGWVRNTANGVQISIWGSETEIDRFLDRVRLQAPAHAQIKKFSRQVFEDAEPVEFRIIGSTGDAEENDNIEVSPDLATCPNCLRDIGDGGSRFFRYPFTNCTDCGPRFSIVTAAPYDRASTSMAVFDKCEVCAAEFRNQENRRFHAQPIACPSCGPKVWLETWDDGGDDIRPAHEAALGIAGAVQALKQGAIVALKGLGGFHLACDATDERTVVRLRARKRRPTKPLALIARDSDVVRRYCRLSMNEESLLSRPEAPIVLLAMNGTAAVAPSVAPGLAEVGFMLPNTAMHHLLLEPFDTPLVMTSGNPSGQPQATQNADARKRLFAIADYGLLHDRGIANRIDDSVVRSVQSQVQVIRRARGYAPASLPLPSELNCGVNVLALGGELKSTFCLANQGRAILSQHLGDLEDVHTFSEFRSSIDLFRDLFQFSPDLIVTDRHPDYLSTQHGHTLATQQNISHLRVQHHHAHVASCLTENNWSGSKASETRVLGVVLDGLGLGDDDAIWGGEFLLANYASFERLAHLEPVSLIGGIQAVREPWRNAYAHLTSSESWNSIASRHSGLSVIEKLQSKPLRTLDAMRDRHFNSQISTSCGRLFDAVSAVVGLQFERQDYEGQAAMLLEAALDHDYCSRLDPVGYHFAVVAGHCDRRPVISATQAWSEILSDISSTIPTGVMSAKFHIGLAASICAMVRHLKAIGKVFNTVALTGGCFQNVTLQRLVEAGLRRDGFNVLTQHQIPANDGGLALGQAAIALAHAKMRTKP